MKQSTKTTAIMGLLIAMALILAYVEVLLPPLFPAVPGIKIGLPNIVVIFLLYRRGAIPAIVVSLLRIVLATLLFGNVSALLYSLAGATLSLLTMIVLRRLNILSTVGVSIAGGVMHNVGQVLAAMLLLDTTQLGYYMIVLTITGTIAGIFVGLCGSTLLQKIPDKFFNFDK